MAGQWVLELHCSQTTAAEPLDRAVAAAAVGGGWCLLHNLRALKPRLLNHLSQMLREVRDARSCICPLWCTPPPT